MRTLERTAPAPADLGTAVIGVPEGTDIELDLRLESVMEGILVTGTVGGEAVGECVRCLEEVREDLDTQLTELFVYPERAAAAVAEGDDEEADEVFEVVDELLDLEPVVRDAVVMNLPFRPLCQPDCRGLCSECGVRLSDPGNEDHHHESIDPRWKALQGLGELSQDGEGSGGEGEETDR
ncbi:YceD family protein [Flavimobilis soli]|nr:YceD family protein [Flavimobilis soli]